MSPEHATMSQAQVYTVEQHLERILRAIGPLQAYDQPIVESMGLPLAADIVAPHDLPRFASAQVDGYAVRAEDVSGASGLEPVVLQVVGDVPAGTAKPFAVAGGSAVRISAGAPVPTGADAVIALADTDRGVHRVTISRAARSGEMVSQPAEELAAGAVALAEGTVLGSREIGLLAAMGMGRVLARPRPRVVILSTGTELREPGNRLDSDSVYDGNSYMLAAAARAAGAIAYRVGIVPDSPRSFISSLHDQLVRADLIVTSGGISDSEHDVVKRALKSNSDVQFCEVAMEPGRLQGFGIVGEEQTPILTLPGHPVSAYVSFEVFVLPAIRRMMGLAPYRRPLVHAVLTSDIRSEAGQRDYVRAVFEVTHRGAKVTPVSRMGRHHIGGLTEANALVVVGDDETALNLGDTVRTLVLDRPF